jgi:hypothetical protein
VGSLAGTAFVDLLAGTNEASLIATGHSIVVSRRLVPAAVLVLVVLAGCIGGIGTGPSSETTSTSEQLDPGDADLPPGVSESGVTNASALVAAHEQTLRAEGFVLNGTFVRDPPNAGNETRRYHTVIAPGGRPFHTDVRSVRYASDDSGSAVSQRLHTRVWANETTMLRQTTIRNSTASSAIDGLPPALSLTRAPQYDSYLEFGEYTVERVVARDGHTFTTLVATDTTDALGPDATIDARFVVDERGVVHEATVTLDGGPNAETDHATYRVVRLGASPTQPGWVANATAD